MRLTQGSAEETDIVWYFVPDDRPVLTGDNSFRSRIYERDDEPQLDIGERYSPVPWYGGQVPGFVGVKGTCGTELQWSEGLNPDDPPCHPYPGTNLARCCSPGAFVGVGGVRITAPPLEGEGMDQTLDLYQPFGFVTPILTGVACQFFSALDDGRAPQGTSTVVWTHYIDVPISVPIQDGCTRTATLDSINYFDGDEVRIPSGGANRFVVVWVTPYQSGSTVVRRCYLLRHGTGWI